MMKLCSRIIILITIMTISAYSQEILYPSGNNIQCSYSVSDTEISVADTMIIRRTLVNNEGFSLENLYFSENIPNELDVASYNVSINGIAIDYNFSGPIPDDVVDGYEAYYWVIDSPIEEGINNDLNSGDSIELEIKIISNTPGSYTLPLHTTVFFGNGSGFFSTSDEIEIEFLISVDICNDNENINNLVPNHLISYAYPNPFNSAVKIWYSGINPASRHVSLTIFDILGKKIYSGKYFTDGAQDKIYWSPNKDASSGIYFYRLSSGAESYNGKLVFLK